MFENKSKNQSYFTIFLLFILFYSHNADALVQCASSLNSVEFLLDKYGIENFPKKNIIYHEKNIGAAKFSETSEGLNAEFCFYGSISPGMYKGKVNVCIVDNKPYYSGGPFDYTSFFLTDGDRIVMDLTHEMVGYFVAPISTFYFTDFSKGSFKLFQKYGAHHYEETSIIDWEKFAPCSGFAKP